MTMIPCPKCGQHLVRDDDAVCPDCKAIADAVSQAKRSAIDRKVKAVAMLVVDMSKALTPIFKPVVERMLAKPITSIVFLLVGWGILYGPSKDTTPARSQSSSVSSSSSAPKEVVYNSAWDGSVRQVEQYLDRNLKDPDSFEAIEWSKVIGNGDGFAVRCKYRAKNSLGGYVIEEQIFVMNKRGDVISVSDWGRP